MTTLWTRMGTLITANNHSVGRLNAVEQLSHQLSTASIGHGNDIQTLLTGAPATTTGKTPKISLPATYKGEFGQKLEDWTAKFKLYCNINAHLFADDDDKIIFAATCFEGTALHWVQPIVENISTDVRAISWKTFEDALRTTFGDPYIEEHALEDLLHLHMNESFVNYVTEFRRLMGLAKVTDTVTIRHAFYEGLRSNIKDAMVHDPRGIPKVLTDLVDVARDIDNRIGRRAQEKRAANLGNPNPRPPARSIPQMALNEATSSKSAAKQQAAPMTGIQYTGKAKTLAEQVKSGSLPMPQGMELDSTTNRLKVTAAEKA